MADNNSVVLVSTTEGVIVKGIERKLIDAGVNVTYCPPAVNQISAFEETVFLYIIYLNNDLDAMTDTLTYLSDMVKSDAKDLVIIGEKTEHEDLRKDLPDVRITQWYERPLNLDAFAAGVKTELNVRSNRIMTKSILVVDDDPSFVRIIRDWLKADYQVYAVTSGMQAISFLMKKNVDLILLDYEMPITTGPQVLRMLRSEPETADIPIVFLTGIGDAESVKQVIALKPDGYILKSTPKPDLLQWIRMFFSKRI